MRLKSALLMMLLAVGHWGCSAQLTGTAPVNDSQSPPPNEAKAAHPPARWSTNAPAIFLSVTAEVTNIVKSTRPVLKIPTNLPPAIQARLATNALYSPEAAKPIVQVRTVTNTTFAGFLPGSLNEVIWTNFIAHTNGRSTLIWRVRSRPPGWPRKPPVVAWNTNGLMWGMKGLTALSPCWEGEGLPGQVPITALTRRHGYTRGHSMGPSGFRKDLNGKKVWFVTLDNQVVEATIAAAVVRTVQADGRDYTLLLFAHDLPASIEPMRVARGATVLQKYKAISGAPRPVFLTEQTGRVSADVPPFQVPILKGGDSGSPNMLPMPGELVFFAGRTTSSPSPEMQADMDQLCRNQGLGPRNYQLQWYDLSRYPSY